MLPVLCSLLCFVVSLKALYFSTGFTILSRDHHQQYRHSEWCLPEMWFHQKSGWLELRALFCVFFSFFLLQGQERTDISLKLCTNDTKVSNFALPSERRSAVRLYLAELDEKRTRKNVRSPSWNRKKHIHENRYPRRTYEGLQKEHRTQWMRHNGPTYNGPHENHGVISKQKSTTLQNFK